MVANMAGIPQFAFQNKPFHLTHCFIDIVQLPCLAYFVVNIMVADAPAPGVTRTSAPMMLCVQMSGLFSWWLCFAVRTVQCIGLHDDVIKWKHFPHYWPFVRGIQRSPVNSPHKCPVTLSLDVFFDLGLNKRSSKQSRGWWFETPSRPWWRHCNG